MRQPIDVRAHSLIDYGFTALNVTGPFLLGLLAALGTVYSLTDWNAEAPR